MFWQGSDGKSLLMLGLFHQDRTSVCHLPLGLEFFGCNGLGAGFLQGLGSTWGLSVLICPSRITCDAKERDFNSQPPQSNVN